MYQTRKCFTVFLGLLALSGVRAQAPAPQDFAAFARDQNKLLTQCYEQRDAGEYARVLDRWLLCYRQLPEAKQQTFRPQLANAYYNFACTYALLGQVKPALDQLALAIGAGYGNYAHIQRDSDLDGLRKEPRFLQLLEPLRATGDFLYILRRGSRYDTNDRRSLPAFTYQPASNEHLAALRASYRLDSIAGKGNDVSKALNLLHWVHGLIKHDGNHNNPAVRNAQSMIGICRQEDRGLNCRGLAIVLNECYLAMGFASRLVTCLPKDSLGTDPDCHVINVVYLPSLKKWVWTDPTRDAYVMNEKGELLDIREVRERLINGLPLILNPTANWNYQVSATKDEYLYRYMAKNLYMLQCPVNSAYNMETPEPGKTIQYIQLMPLDYFKQGPDVRTTGEKAGTTYQCFNTNNPDAFWRAPL